MTWTTLLETARSGRQLISFPTDTVPALASKPDRASLIYEAKQRSETKPLILMGGDIEDGRMVENHADVSIASPYPVCRMDWLRFQALHPPKSPRRPLPPQGGTRPAPSRGKRREL